MHLAGNPTDVIQQAFKGSSALSVQGGDGKLDEFDTLKL
jgi:hypothetical protein